MARRRFETNEDNVPVSVTAGDARIALFIDFENIALGVREAKYSKFEINLLLERLVDKGKIVVKRAYSDWDRFPDYKREFHESAIEMIEIPRARVLRQELGRHPDGGRRHGHVVVEGSHRHLRHRLG
jgi:hypothetical protein